MFRWRVLSAPAIARVGALAVERAEAAKAKAMERASAPPAPLAKQLVGGGDGAVPLLALPSQQPSAPTLRGDDGGDPYPERAEGGDGDGEGKAARFAFPRVAG